MSREAGAWSARPAQPAADDAHQPARLARRTLAARGPPLRGGLTAGRPFATRRALLERLRRGRCAAGGPRRALFAGTPRRGAPLALARTLAPGRARGRAGEVRPSPEASRGAPLALSRTLAGGAAWRRAKLRFSPEASRGARSRFSNPSPGALRGGRANCAFAKPRAARARASRTLRRERGVPAGETRASRRKPPAAPARASRTPRRERGVAGGRTPLLASPSRGARSRFSKASPGVRRRPPAPASLRPRSAKSSPDAVAPPGGVANRLRRRPLGEADHLDLDFAALAVGGGRARRRACAVRRPRRAPRRARPRRACACAVRSARRCGQLCASRAAPRRRRSGRAARSSRRPAAGAGPSTGASKLASACLASLGPSWSRSTRVRTSATSPSARSPSSNGPNETRISRLTAQAHMLEHALDLAVLALAQAHRDPDVGALLALELRVDAGDNGCPRWSRRRAARRAAPASTSPCARTR